MRAFPLPLCLLPFRTGLQSSPYSVCAAPRQHVKKLASKAFDEPDSSASAAPAMHRPSRAGSNITNSASTRRSRITQSQNQNLAGKTVRDARGAVRAMLPAPGSPGSSSVIRGETLMRWHAALPPFALSLPPLVSASNSPRADPCKTATPRLGVKTRLLRL